MNIGENIKKYRLLKNLTRKDLAKELEVSESTISRYENGKREPNLDTLNKISKVLRVNMTDLTRYDESFDFEILFEAMNLGWDYFSERGDNNILVLLGKYIHVDHETLTAFHNNEIPNLPLIHMKGLLKFISEKSPKQFNKIYSDLISVNMYDLNEELKSYCKDIYSKTKHVNAFDISDHETVQLFLFFMKSHGYQTNELNNQTLEYLYGKVIDLLDYEIYKLEKANFELKDK